MKTYAHLKAIILALITGMAVNGQAQEIISLEEGYLTFANDDTSRYYRVEFKPVLDDSLDWDGTFRDLRNIQSASTEVTVPIGRFYRVVSSETPWVGGTASPADILIGKTAYTNDAPITGTMPDIGRQDIMPGIAPLPIAQGYHDGSGTVEGAIHLLPENIRAGMTIFAVTGTVIEAVGTADAQHVLSGQTFSRTGADNLTGTMTNIGQQSIMPGTVPQSIAQGYHDGTGAVAGDADLVAENIRAGVTIFETTGNYVGSALVPKTGQGPTESDRTGDDGNLQFGAPWPSPRFTDHGDGTVTDNLTGLMWTKNSDLPGGTRTWPDAIDYCLNMNTGPGTFGYTDWRLPNVRELHSLIDYGRDFPALPTGHPFSNMSSSKDYWTSSTFSIFSEQSWYIRFGRGNVDFTDKTTAYYVWPVRGP